MNRHETAQIFLVGAGGFREFWEEIFIPKMKDFAVPVAAVDVSEEALKLPVKYGTVPAEKCYTDPRKAIEENPLRLSGADDSAPGADAVHRSGR